MIGYGFVRFCLAEGTKVMVLHKQNGVVAKPVEELQVNDTLLDEHGHPQYVKVIYNQHTCDQNQNLCLRCDRDPSSVAPLYTVTQYPFPPSSSSSNTPPAVLSSLMSFTATGNHRITLQCDFSPIRLKWERYHYHNEEQQVLALYYVIRGRDSDPLFIKWTKAIFVWNKTKQCVEVIPPSDGDQIASSCNIRTDSLFVSSHKQPRCNECLYYADSLSQMELLDQQRATTLALKSISSSSSSYYQLCITATKWWTNQHNRIRVGELIDIPIELYAHLLSQNNVTNVDNVHPVLSHFGMYRAPVVHWPTSKHVCKNEKQEKHFSILSPYILGLWLGFRFQNHSIIDDNDHNRYTNIIEKWINSPLQKFSSSSSPLRNADSKKLIDALHYFDLVYSEQNTSHIPCVYLYSSWRSRQELISGVIDSDCCMVEEQYGGWILNVYQSQISMNFLKDLLFLCHSIGLSLHPHPNFVYANNESRRNNNDSSINKLSLHLIGLTQDTLPLVSYVNQTFVKSHPFAVSKFRMLHSTEGGFVHRLTIKKNGNGRFIAFKVSSINGRFLLSDFIVTHNSDENECKNAIEEMNGMYLLSRPMRVKPAIPKPVTPIQQTIYTPSNATTTTTPSSPPQSQTQQTSQLQQAQQAFALAPTYAQLQGVEMDDASSSTVYVTNLGSQVAPEQLRSQFEEYGEVLKIEAGKGYGWVQFLHPQSAAAAAAAIPGVIVMGTMQAQRQLSATEQQQLLMGMYPYAYYDPQYWVEQQQQLQQYQQIYQQQLYQSMVPNNQFNGSLVSSGTSGEDEMDTETALSSSSLSEQAISSYFSPASSVASFSAFSSSLSSISALHSSALVTLSSAAAMEEEKEKEELGEVFNVDPTKPIDIEKKNKRYIRQHSTALLLPLVHSRIHSNPTVSAPSSSSPPYSFNRFSGFLSKPFLV